MVIGALWVASHVIGGIVSGISTWFRYGPDRSESSASWSASAAPTPEGQLEDGMRLEPVRTVTEPTAIFWRINPTGATANEQVDYTVWHDGSKVRTFPAVGYVVTSERYAPGHWSISWPSAVDGECTVFVGGTPIATMEQPTPDGCVLDTSWVQTQTP